jgi:hypothetical protein
MSQMRKHYTCIGGAFSRYLKHREAKQLAKNSVGSWVAAAGTSSTVRFK